MTLEEAFNCLRRDILDPARRSSVEEACKVLRAGIEEIVLGAVYAEHRREIVARSVFDKVEERALLGDLPEVQFPRAYLLTAVKHRSMDIVRAEAAAERAEQVLRAKAEAARAAEAALNERRATWAHLERIVAIVLRGMERAHRGSNAQAWQTMVLLHGEDGYTLREAVSIVMKNQIRSENDLDAHVQRMHKAHQRLRRALEAELKARIDGGIDAETAQACRVLVTTLRRRCPNRVPGSVSPAKER